MQYTDEEYRTMFRNSHLLAVQAKETRDDNDSIAPMCVLGFEKVVIPAVMVGVGAGDLYAACKKSIEMVHREVIPDIEKELGHEVGPLLWIVIHAEAYRQTKDGEKDLDEIRESFVPLAPLFAAGDPSVKECITTVGIYPGGQFHISHAFRWTPVDGYEWDNPPEEFDEPGDDRWTFFSLTQGVE